MRQERNREIRREITDISVDLRKTDMWGKENDLHQEHNRRNRSSRGLRAHSFLVPLLVPTMRVGALGDAWDAFRPLPELARWPLAWFVATVVFVSAFAWEYSHGRR